MVNVKNSKNNLTFFELWGANYGPGMPILAWQGQTLMVHWITALTFESKLLESWEYSLNDSYEKYG